MAYYEDLSRRYRRRDVLVKPQVVTYVLSGQRGRPSIHIDPDVLKEATSSHRHITLTALSNALGVHRQTLAKQLKAHNLTTPRYSDIPDHALDILVRHFRELHPKSGSRYVQGFLASHGIKVQRSRVRASIRRVDGLGQVLRNHATIDRREYSVPYPNYLWHIDGHHKLIRWGIVIHGGADGYDRMVSSCLICTTCSYLY